MISTFPLRGGTAPTSSFVSWGQHHDWATRCVPLGQRDVVGAVPGDCTDVNIRARERDDLAESDAWKCVVHVDVGAVPRFQAWSYQRQHPQTSPAALLRLRVASDITFGMISTFPLRGGTAPTSSFVSWGQHHDWATGCVPLGQHDVVGAVPGDCTDVNIRARVSDVLAESDAGEWMVAVDVGAVPRFQAWSYQRQGTHKLPPLRSSV